MIIEYVGVHRKALNPCKKYQFFYHLGQCLELLEYMHKKQIPMQEWICIKCPQTSHVEGDQLISIVVRSKHAWACWHSARAIDF